MSRLSALKQNKQTIRQLFPYLKPYMGYLILSLLLSLVYVAGTLYIPVLIGDAVDQILYIGNVNFEALWDCLIRFAVTIVVAAIAQWLMNICNNRMTYYMVRDVRRDAIRKIETLPLSYLDGKASGEIVSRVITDVDLFADGLLMGFTQFFTSVITILGTLVFMLMIHPVVTLVVVLITPLSLFVAAFITKQTYNLFGARSKLRGEQTGLIDEMVSHLKVVQAFNREEHVLNTFDGINGNLSSATLRAVFFSSLTNPSTRFVNNLVYAGVGVCGALFCLASVSGTNLALLGGAITVGQLAAFLGYANQYTKPFNEISGVVTELQNAFVCADRVLQLISEEPESADYSDAVYLSEEGIGNVELKDVSFSYIPDRKLLTDVNLKVERGKRIAIVGPTGCGKTTLINLLMRFYDVNSGSILVEDTDIRDIKRESLRRSYGMVLQETWLKTGTVKENIALGKEDATDEEIIEAAKRSHAHGFIKRLPNGYDTILSDQNDNLSQGQKQLLCIARVMLNIPPMLILDEATSSIDTRTEIRVQKAFHTLMEGRTTFIVAHRLSTIKEADLILVMKDGNIIEQGTHTELLKKNGFYATLYRAGTETGV